MEKTIKSSAINWGLYLGVVLSLFTVLGYMNLDLYTKWWYGIIMLIVIIVFGIISSMKSKKILNGFISFKEAFSSYFITIALGFIISTVISIIIFNFVDPEAATTLQEKIIDVQVQMMRRFGAPEDAIAQAVTKLEEQDNMFSIGNMLQSLAFQLIGYSIVGLIVALVVKKNNPEAE